MSVIRPIKPRHERRVCPDCGAPEGLFIDLDRKLTCKLCGWKSSDPVGNASDYTITAKQNETPERAVLRHLAEADGEDEQDIRDLRKLKATYFSGSRAQISTWGSAAYDSAIAHIQKREWEDAIKALYRVIDNDPDFIDAHLWLGRLLTDEEKQREHLSTVIAHKPQHAEAMLELMYLNGQIGLTQLEDVLNNNREVQIQTTDAPVQSETTILSCPVCGGHMTTHPITGHVECAFCGHVEETDHPESTTTGGLLTTALLQQRSDGVKWVIGDRLLRCNNCGAESTIPEGQMGTHCKFCGSNHIIEQDALNSFRQPEGIIPFTIPQEQAEDMIYEKLTGRWERFKGLFVNNKVTQATFAGTYLPFWVFDIVLDVKLSWRVTDSQSIRYGAAPTRTETRADVYNNYPFPAVVSPSPRLLEKITRYDFSLVKPYDANLLARYPAEIYSIDFDTASIEVRGSVRRKTRERMQAETALYQSEEVTSISSMIQNMSFRLLLLPVWVATLVEDDGDVRIGLVNGQTGHAVLGKARQPENLNLL